MNMMPMPMLFVPDIGRPQQKVILGIIYKYGKQNNLSPHSAPLKQGQKHQNGYKNGSLENHQQK